MTKQPQLTLDGFYGMRFAGAWLFPGSRQLTPGRGGVNVERPQRASARTNDVDARKDRRTLGWRRETAGGEG